MSSDARCRRWAPRLLSLALAAAPAALPLEAAAQEPAAAIPEPTAADKETARGLMDQGVDREVARDYKGALRFYQGAHALVRLPMTGVAVARTQEALGLYVEAVDTATEVGHLPRRAGETPAYDRARAEAAELVERASRRISSLEVSVSGAPGGVRVSIDGAPIPAEVLGLPRKVNPGKHVIIATAPGNREARAEVNVGEGEVVPVSLQLEGAGAATAAPAREPPADAPASSGGGVPALAWVGFGVGAAGLLVGGVAGVVALGQGSALAEECPGQRCVTPEAQDALSTANLTANISNVGLVIGAAGIGVGVVALLLSGGDDRAAARPRLQVAPWAGPGIGVRGSF